MNEYNLSQQKYAQEIGITLQKSITDAKAPKPDYENMQDWAFYASDIMIEYQQSIDEGLDIEGYKKLFEDISNLPNNEIKKDLADELQKIISSANIKADYKYIEPSELSEIKSLRKTFKTNEKAPSNVDDDTNYILLFSELAH